MSILFLAACSAIRTAARLLPSLPNDQYPGSPAATGHNLRDTESDTAEPAILNPVL